MPQSCIWATTVLLGQGCHPSSSPPPLVFHGPAENLSRLSLQVGWVGSWRAAPAARAKSGGRDSQASHSSALPLSLLPLTLSPLIHGCSQDRVGSLRRLRGRLLRSGLSLAGSQGIRPRWEPLLSYLINKVRACLSLGSGFMEPGQGAQTPRSIILLGTLEIWGKSSHRKVTWRCVMNRKCRSACDRAWHLGGLGTSD